MAKHFTPGQVYTIRLRNKKGESITTIAKDLGTEYSTIRRIIKRETFGYI